MEKRRHNFDAQESSQNEFWRICEINNGNFINLLNVIHFENLRWNMMKMGFAIVSADNQAWRLLFMLSDLKLDSFCFSLLTAMKLKMTAPDKLQYHPMVLSSTTEHVSGEFTSMPSSPPPLSQTLSNFTEILLNLQRKIFSFSFHQNPPITSTNPFFSQQSLNP